MKSLICFSCPGCHQEMEGEEDYIFQQVICPTCQHEFYPQPKKTFADPSERRIKNKVYDPAQLERERMQRFETEKPNNFGAGIIIWPVVLIGLLASIFLGAIPVVWGWMLIVLAILGAIVSQLANRK